MSFREAVEKVKSKKGEEQFNKECACFIGGIFVGTVIGISILALIQQVLMAFSLPLYF